MDDEVRFEFFEGEGGKMRYAVNGVSSDIPSWAKRYYRTMTSVVSAVQIPRPFKIYGSREGVVVGKRGDYLEIGPLGQLGMWPQMVFELTYEPLEEEQDGQGR